MDPRPPSTPGALQRLRAFAVAVLLTCAVLASGDAAPATATAPQAVQAAAVCTVPSGVHGPVWAGEQRRYRLLVPAGANAATKVYVVLHGAGGTAESMAGTSGMDDLAARGAIVVYPQAASSTSNVWQVDPGTADTGFVAWVVSNLHASGCGSPGTTSLSGWSMGAMMTSRMLCLRGDLFSSAVMVDGALPPLAGCKVRPDTPVTILHGTADPILAWDGSIPNLWVRSVIGADRQNIDFPGVPRDAMARMWQQAKGCPAAPAGWPTMQGVAWLDLTSCATAPTRIAAVFGGGHDWDPYGAANPGWTRERIVENAAGSGARGFAASPGQVLRVHASDTPGGVVAGTLTAVAPGSDGWLAAYRCTDPRPTVSQVTYRRGATTAGFIVSATDAAGDLCICTSGYAQLLFDRAGSTSSMAPDARRAWDTRVGTKPAGGAVVPVRVGPAHALVAGTLTVAAPEGAGFATVFSCDAPRPWASTANYSNSANTSAAALVRSDANGAVCIYTSNPAHLIFDIAATGPVPPDTATRRLNDTRETSPGVPPSGSVLQIRTGLPAGSSVWLNVTATGASGAGHATVFTCGSARPTASTNNYTPGRTSANAALATTSSDGTVCVYISSPTHVVVDASASFTGGQGLAASAPTRLLDTRNG